MINFEALYTVSYGLYIVSSGDSTKGNGYISNTVFQVTSEPPRFATCCNKDNFTAGLIQSCGNFSVSVLHTGSHSDIFGRFGYKSGRDINKFEGMKVIYGETGVPIIINDCMAFLEYRLVRTIDLDTHLMFIGDLVQAELIDHTKEPMTYSYYRHVKKGFPPKNAPTYIDKAKLEKTIKTAGNKQYKCTLCGYLYDENDEAVKFADLDKNWVCPLCGAPKTDFIDV